MVVISAENVTFAYGDEPVVESISLDVEEGAFLGLVGPNGSGKTTLLQLLIGLRRPDSGTIQLFGEPAYRFDDGERVGYVPQAVNAANLELPVTVEEAVRMGRYPRRWFTRFTKTDYRAVEAALERVGIADLADRRVARLSGGQRQRVFIARALAGEADLLALDEPTAGVDAESREAFYELLRELNDNGLTIVMVEHDIGVVTAYASEIACLNRGLYFHGAPERFVETDALTQAYGGGQRVLHHDNP